PTLTPSLPSCSLSPRLHLLPAPHPTPVPTLSLHDALPISERRGLQPLGAYRGIAVAGCAPDEMGIGPVFAVPKLLQQHGLKVDEDRKSTRLNSSHEWISYAVFCLKKKKNTRRRMLWDGD